MGLQRHHIPQVHCILSMEGFRCNVWMDKVNMPDPMNGENRQLVTDETVEFEETWVQIQDFRNVTKHF